MSVLLVFTALKNTLINVGAHTFSLLLESIPGVSHFENCFDVVLKHNLTGVAYGCTVKTEIVQVYSCADGNAANTHSIVGIVWLVHFSPNQVGQWLWDS